MSQKDKRRKTVNQRNLANSLYKDNEELLRRIARLKEKNQELKEALYQSETRVTQVKDAYRSSNNELLETERSRLEEQRQKLNRLNQKAAQDNKQLKRELKKLDVIRRELAKIYGVDAIKAIEQTVSEIATCPECNGAGGAHDDCRRCAGSGWIHT